MAADAPVLRIELRPDVPAYRQIVDGLRTALVSKQVQPGDLLPPVRQLAVDLGVHFNTVAEAYRVLAEEGWLDLKRRRGALVLARKAPERITADRADQMSRRLHDVVAELRAAGVSAAKLARELRGLAEGLEE